MLLIYASLMQMDVFVTWSMGGRHTVYRNWIFILGKLKTFFLLHLLYITYGELYYRYTLYSVFCERVVTKKKKKIEGECRKRAKATESLSPHHMQSSLRPTSAHKHASSLPVLSSLNSILQKGWRGEDVCVCGFTASPGCVD